MLYARQLRSSAAPFVATALTTSLMIHHGHRPRSCSKRIYGEPEPPRGGPEPGTAQAAEADCACMYVYPPERERERVGRSGGEAVVCGVHAGADIAEDELWVFGGHGAGSGYRGDGTGAQR